METNQVLRYGYSQVCKTESCPESAVILRKKGESFKLKTFEDAP
jgi:hypothetical protein